MTTVHIVDDDESIRRSLRRLLSSGGYEPRCYASSEEFMSGEAYSDPGCLILDLNLPGADGLDLQSQLHGKEIRVPVIFMSGVGDVRSSVRAMKAGAVDFLTKPVAAKDLFAAVETALERDRNAREEQDAERRYGELVGSLTPREREVMEGVVAGLLNKQIAAQLEISEKTTKIHRGRVMKKMNVTSLAELVKLFTTHRP